MRTLAIRIALGVVLLSGVAACSTPPPAQTTSSAAACGRVRPHGAADRRADTPTRQGVRRPQRKGSGTLGGQAPRRRSERGHRSDRRHRLWAQQCVWRADQHADAGKAGEQRAPLQPLSHHGPVQPNARGAADRTQPPCQQRRRDHGAGDGLSRQYRRAAERDHDARRDPQAKRLQHGGFRQIPRDAALGSVHVGAV